MTFLTITPAAWYMAGISVCVVFCILLVLVFVLVLFGYIARQNPVNLFHHKHASTPALAPGMHADEAEGEALAAVAAAVYLYLNSGHDEESGVVTINNSRPSNWHAVLNPRL